MPEDYREIIVVSDDGLAESAVRLTPELWEFDYADNRELAEGQIYDSALVLTPQTGERRTQSRIGFVRVAGDDSEN